MAFDARARQRTPQLLTERFAVHPSSTPGAVWLQPLAQGAPMHLGALEWRIAQLLDGQRTLGALQLALGQQHLAVSEAALASLLDQLAQARWLDGWPTPSPSVGWGQPASGRWPGAQAPRASRTRSSGEPAEGPNIGAQASPRPQRLPKANTLGLPPPTDGWAWPGVRPLFRLLGPDRRKNAALAGAAMAVLAALALGWWRRPAVAVVLCLPQKEAVVWPAHAVSRSWPQQTSLTAPQEAIVLAVAPPGTLLAAGQSAATVQPIEALLPATQKRLLRLRKDTQRRIAHAAAARRRAAHAAASVHARAALARAQRAYESHQRFLLREQQLAWARQAPVAPLPLASASLARVVAPKALAGQTLARGAPVVRLADARLLRLRLQGRGLPSLRPGDEVWLRPGAGAQPLLKAHAVDWQGPLAPATGAVDAVARAARIDGHSTVWVDLPDPSGAWSQLPLPQWQWVAPQREWALSVPSSALVGEGARRFLWWVDHDNAVQRTQVRVLGADGPTARVRWPTGGDGPVRVIPTPSSLAGRLPQRVRPVAPLPAP